VAGPVAPPSPATSGGSAEAAADDPLGGAGAALRGHWPEYAIEAGGLACFMLSACLFATLFEHPASPFRQAVPDPRLRRIAMGLAMGLTAVALIYSPWGRRSGAHLNPAVTLTFWRLGKVEPWDALFYALAQFAGGITGVGMAAALLAPALADPAVHYAVTTPGAAGVAAAFAAEGLIAFLLMSVILQVSNRAAVARLTGLCAGALVATYIVLEAPLSGMSMNPARTLGSASQAGVWTALWVYFAAPPLGMLAAAELYRWRAGAAGVRCAKLRHDARHACIFRCGYRDRS
jgi:aquaporin Z